MIKKNLISASVFGLGAIAVVASALPVLAQSAAAVSSQQLSKTNMAKVSGNLLKLYKEYQDYQNQSYGTNFKSSEPNLNINADMVVFDAAASGDPKALANELKQLGAQSIVVFGHKVSGRLPLSAIPQLENLTSLQLIRPSYIIKHSGSITSQGDMSMHSDVARTSYGVDGTGVKVGTLSDSYNCLGGADDGVATGDLPANVNVIMDDCPGSDEGRAMMEIIHDIAPGAELSFHATPSETGFAAGILALAADGATVINDDISFASEPFYQDGVIAQAIDTVVAQGVSYFTATGNAARKAYEAPFRLSGQTVNIGFGPQEAHDFDSGAGVDICQQVIIPPEKSITVSFQWDQPFFSVSGAPGSASDIDIILTNESCDTSAPLAVAADNNIGGDPIEILSFENTTDNDFIFNLVILSSSGPIPGLMKTIDAGEVMEYNEFDTKTGASYGHPLAKGASGVAAAWYNETPFFGTNPPVVEGSSSAGGSPILFDVAGNRLATPEVRQNPTITAPDGVDTSFFGGSDPEGNGFNNFFGTSAAAPHAAGVAALMNQLVPGISPEDINTALQNTAIDMDDPSTPEFDTGVDFGTGYGLIQADAALNAIAPPTVIAGDFDMDGDVDLNDLMILRGQFGSQVEPGSPFDMNNDGTINVLDYRLVINACTRTRCAVA